MPQTKYQGRKPGPTGTTVVGCKNGVIAALLPLLVLICCNLFARSQSTTAQTAQSQSYVMVGDIPEHRIGRNDVLRVTVWNGLQVEEATAKVAEDGTVFIPLGVNQTFHVLGLPSSQLKQRIQQEALKYFREVIVQVVIEEYNANRAYLLGEVRSTAGGGPGLYSLEGRKRVLEFIIERGGFTEQANMTKVQINRATGEVLVLNLSDVIFQGDENQNVVVNPGDVVWVPSKEVGANTYYVFGEVGSPGVVTSQENLTLVEAISSSGSFTVDADRDQVYIARGSLDQPQILQQDLKRLIEKADFSQNVTLQNNDIVFVPRRGLARYRDVIQVISPLLGLLRDTVFLVRIGRN